VRVIGASGEMLGVMTVAEALRAAVRAGLDLVEVNPRGSPPVCKLLDFRRLRRKKEE
jgi:translation initiation factor IF-3